MKKLTKTELSDLEVRIFLFSFASVYMGRLQKIWDNGKENKDVFEFFGHNESKHFEDC